MCVFEADPSCQKEADQTSNAQVANPIIAVTSFEDYILAFDSKGTITMYNQDFNEMTSLSLQPKDG